MGMHKGTIELPDIGSLFAVLLVVGDMKTISQMPSWFFQQKPGFKLMIGGVGLFFLLCLCGGLATTFGRLGQAPTITLTFKGADNLILITWTPAGSLTPTASDTPTATPAPTRTPLPTELPTRSFETPTVVILPTGTIRPVIVSDALVILHVDKTEEYVDIKNLGAPVFLFGWTLVSERGDQRCELNGFLDWNQILRVWAGTHDTGYSCGFLRTIWTDHELDPAVLYDPDGREVSRYP